MRNHWLAIVGILATALLLYWQVTCMQGIVRWDATHCFLAWRQGVADLIQQGSLPLWSPYQHLGFPLHADPETGANYPIVWLISLLGGYDFIWFNVEWCLHIAIAGWGTYFLLLSMNTRKVIAFIAAVSFMGCGVFVSNAQNYIYLIALAWSPWALRELRLFLRTIQLKHAASLALVMFMMMTGGYPGITMIFCYGLVIAVLMSFFFLTKGQWKFRLRQQGFGLLVFAILLGLLVAPHLLSIAEYLPQLTRAEGLTEKRILENPFPVDAYISFLTPYAVGTRQDVDWHSDFSMINSYIGLLMLSLVFTWLISPGKTKREWLLFTAAIGLLAVALGEATPLRMWLAKLPALGLFRHPSIFRFHALLLLVLLGATSLERILTLGKIEKLRWGLAVTASLLIAVCVLHPPIAWKEAFLLTWSEWLERPLQSAVHWHDRIWIQSAFGIITIGAIFLSLRSQRSPQLLASIVLIDMLIATQWNVPSTVVYPFDFASNQNRLTTILRQPEAYNNQALIDFCSEKDTLHLEPIAENEFMYLRKPAWDGYNSFILHGYNEYEHDTSSHWTLHKGLLFASDSTEINQVAMGCNTISCTTSTPFHCTLTLQQNAHANWSCELDGQETPVRTVHHTLMEIDLPEGHHVVQFKYASIRYEIGLTMMVIGLLACSYFILKKLH